MCKCECGDPDRGLGCKLLMVLPRCDCDDVRDWDCDKLLRELACEAVLPVK